jgi:hypothetical protein
MPAFRTRDDRTHILNISQVYEFPFGHGKKFLNHRGALIKNLVGGWEISGNYYYATGTPVQIIEIGRPLGFTNAPNRANILPGSFDVNWDNYYTGQPIFDVKKFQTPVLSRPRRTQYVRHAPFAHGRGFWARMYALRLWYSTSGA